MTVRAKEMAAAEATGIGGRARLALVLGSVTVLVTGALLVRALAVPPGTRAGASGQGGSGGAAAIPALMRVDSARLLDLEREIASDSDNAHALIEAGHAYLQLQRFDESARVSMKALSLDSTAAEAHAHLGMILWAGHDPHAALAALDRALQISPDLPEALLYRGLVLFVQSRDFPGAADALGHYLRVAPLGTDTRRVRQMLEMARTQPRGSRSS